LKDESPGAFPINAADFQFEGQASDFDSSSATGQEPEDEPDQEKTLNVVTEHRNPISKHLLLLFKWQYLLAVPFITGAVRYSVEQYEFFRNILNWLLNILQSEEDTLPSYPFIQKKLIPAVQKFCFPRSNKHYYELDLSKPGARSCAREKDKTAEMEGRPRSGRNGIPLVPVKVVYPSEWARQDVSLKAIWNCLMTNALARKTTDATVTLHISIKIAQ